MSFTYVTAYTVHPKSTVPLREEVASATNSVSTFDPASPAANGVQEAVATDAGKGVLVPPFRQPAASTLPPFLSA